MISSLRLGGGLGALGFTLMLALCSTRLALGADQPVGVKLAEQDGQWRLIRNAAPYFIQGGGGGGSKAKLAECGGNSFRTWGIGPETEHELDEAQKLGLTVTVGHWLGHKDHGFRYDDPQALAKQFEDVKRAVNKFKHHPALLIWALGNEMEVNNDSPELWPAIQALAKMVHELDPQHPTMTVVAEIGGDKLEQIHRHCPDIDIVGVNTYGGGPSLAERYRKAGGKKPFVITEFGPPGTWEIKANAFGAAPESTSTAKARSYREIYEKSVLGAKDLCLGSYAFTWGHKIEATATWFGMFLPDGDKLAAVDTMQTLWTGKEPKHPCPVMEQLTLEGSDRLKAADAFRARVVGADPSGDPLKIHWALFLEQKNYNVEGTGAAATPSFPEAIDRDGQAGVTVKLPRSGGIYRLYCYLRNAHGGAAVGSLPIEAIGPRTLLKAAAAELPLVVYADDQPAKPFIPSGYMGKHEAIRMQADCEEQPHAGKTCLKVSYTEGNGWGGVVWQNPPNDWGALPGGFDLTGATTLSFWARGAAGGEHVKFGYGILGIDKKYHDSSQAELAVTLAPEWKHYQIDLGEKELTRIKSGFLWTFGATGKPATFYLDDIEYK